MIQCQGHARQQEEDIMNKETKTELYGCKRCGTDLTSEYVPCPRGGCEAEVIGTRITTVTIKLNSEVDLKDYPKNE